MIEGTGQGRTEAQVKKMDKQRGEFYESHVGKSWGDTERFDLHFDSSLNTKEEIADVIIDSYNKL
mgnify:FL=1